MRACARKKECAVGDISIMANISANISQKEKGDFAGDITTVLVSE